MVETSFEVSFGYCGCNDSNLAWLKPSQYYASRTVSGVSSCRVAVLNWLPHVYSSGHQINLRRPFVLARWMSTIRQHKRHLCVCNFLCYMDCPSYTSQHKKACETCLKKHRRRARSRSPARQRHCRQRGRSFQCVSALNLWIAFRSAELPPTRHTCVNDTLKPHPPCDRIAGRHFQITETSHYLCPSSVLSLYIHHFGLLGADSVT